jgi:hypothetical protein
MDAIKIEPNLTELAQLGRGDWICVFDFEEIHRLRFAIDYMTIGNDSIVRKHFAMSSASDLPFSSDPEQTLTLPPDLAPPDLHLFLELTPILPPGTITGSQGVRNICGTDNDYQICQYDKAN